MSEQPEHDEQAVGQRDEQLPVEVDESATTSFPEDDDPESLIGDDIDDIDDEQEVSS